MSDIFNRRKVVSGALPYGDGSGYAVEINIEGIDGEPVLYVRTVSMQICQWEEVKREIDRSIAAFMLMCGAAKEGDKP